MATANHSQGPVQRAKQNGERTAKQAAYSPLMEGLTRVGYGVKGLIYLTIGVIALGAAVGKNKTPADQVGAIAALGKLPFGPFILWIILVGLIAYSLWGLIRAFLDPYHHGTDTKGLLTRGGYLVSAITYAAFVLPTWQLIQHARTGASTGQTAQLISQVMEMPWGRWVIGIVGLAIIAGGIYQISAAINSKFEQRFKAYALSAEQQKAINQLGRFGTAARGFVFALAGLFVVLAAYFARPGQARGMDGVMRFLARQPYGLWILGIIAIGLMAFGVYSITGAAWFKLKQPAGR